MDVAQTLWGGELFGVALRRRPGQALRPPGEFTGGAGSASPWEWPGAMSRAFLWAVVLHLMAGVGLVWMVEHWPALPARSSPVSVALDVMAAPSAPVNPVTEVPAWVHAVAAVTPERRVPPQEPAPIPEASPVSAADAVVIPVVEMPDHPVSPDFARENIRVPAPGASGMPAIPEARQGDGGGHPMALAEIRPYYPYSARTRGEEGKVTVHLRVTSGGSVDSVEIGRSSAPGFSLQQMAPAAHIEYI